MKHQHEIKVYYEDTDAGGIVYYANYLKYAERGRTEYLRSLGFENTSLEAEYGILFVVRHVEADYLASARLDDSLVLETEVIELKNASFAMKQVVFCHQKPIFKMKVVLVAVNNDKKPVKLPEKLKDSLSTYVCMQNEE